MNLHRARTLASAHPPLPLPHAPAELLRLLADAALVGVALRPARATGAAAAGATAVFALDALAAAEARGGAGDLAAAAGALVAAAGAVAGTCVADHSTTKQKRAKKTTSTMGSLWVGEWRGVDGGRLAIGAERRHQSSKAPGSATRAVTQGPGCRHHSRGKRAHARNEGVPVHDRRVWI